MSGVVGPEPDPGERVVYAATQDANDNTISSSFSKRP